MNSTKTARRMGTALAVPALLLVAACGSDDGSGTNGSGSGSEGSPATVSGEPGAPPEIEFQEDAEALDETMVTVLHEGTSATVEAGDYVRVDAVAADSDGTELFNTWGISEQIAAQQQSGEEAESGEDAEEGDGESYPYQHVAQIGADDMLMPIDDLVGETVGSRVVVEGSVGELIGPEAAQMGMSEDEPVAWVFDIAGTSSVDPQGEVEGEQAAPAEGMPEVTVDSGEPADIAIPADQEAPAEYREQVLIDGDGPEVRAGEAAIVQYTGVSWEDGEMFDTSYEREAATGFQVGTGAVVEGFDAALEGKQVGDRVLAVVPPEMGYGQDPSSELADTTLVFAMDIVGVV